MCVLISGSQSLVQLHVLSLSTEEVRWLLLHEQGSVLQVSLDRARVHAVLHSCLFHCFQDLSEAPQTCAYSDQPPILALTS